MIIKEETRAILYQKILSMKENPSFGESKRCEQLFRSRNDCLDTLCTLNFIVESDMIHIFSKFLISVKNKTIIERNIDREVKVTLT